MFIRQFVNNKYSSNTYLITKEGYNWGWLIDISEIESLLKYVPFNFIIKGVFITHSHFDHIYGLNRLIESYPDCSVYISGGAVSGLYSEKINLSFYHQEPVIYRGSNIKLTGEGTCVELFKGYFLEILETPGHNPGCLTFKLKNYLFTGDSYIPGGEVVTRLKGGNIASSRKSLKNIMENISDEVFICPGHGKMVKGELNPSKNI